MMKIFGNNRIRYFNCHYCKKLESEKKLITYSKGGRDKIILCLDCHKKRVKNANTN